MFDQGSVIGERGKKNESDWTLVQQPVPPNGTHLEQVSSSPEGTHTGSSEERG